jgi:hypothetical protein
MEVASERAARGIPAKAAPAAVTNKARLPNHSCGISFGRSIATRMKQQGRVFKQPAVGDSTEWSPIGEILASCCERVYRADRSSVGIYDEPD